MTPAQSRLVELASVLGCRWQEGQGLPDELAHALNDVYREAHPADDERSVDALRREISDELGALPRHMRHRLQALVETLERKLAP